MQYLPVALPQTESQLAVMVSLLEAWEIPYFVFNRGFGGLYPGMPMHLYNSQRIMVHRTRAREAWELLAPIQAPPEDFAAQCRLRWYDRLRVLAELLLGSWCLPSPRRSFTDGVEMEEEEQGR